MPRTSRKPQYIDTVTQMYCDQKMSLSEIADVLPVSVQTLSRWLTEDGVDLEPRFRNPNAGRTVEEQVQINQKIQQTWRDKIEAGEKPVGRTPRVPREDRECQCGKQFTVRKTSVQKYCSMYCARFYQARIEQGKVRQAWYDNEASSCKCGKKIPYERRDTWKYCSVECRKLYGAKRQPKLENYVTFNCLNCDKEVTRYKNYGSGHNKYCSNACAQRHTKTRRFYAVEDFDIVFESSWEALFWSLCQFLKIPVERYDREQGVEWGDGKWYAPDFWLPSIVTAVEIKGQEDDSDTERWDLFRRERGSLIIVDRDLLNELRQATTTDGFTSLL
jgi:hypothetical protein